jgi:hypothetical protein
MPLIARASACGLAGILLAWQGWNAARGRFFHRFVWADVAASALLIASATRAGDRASASWMLGAFAATGGVFLAATTDALAGGGYDLGRGATTLGLAACVAWAWRLGARLARPG